MDDFKIAQTSDHITVRYERAPSLPLPSFLFPHKKKKKKKKKTAHGCIFISASDKCFMCQDDSLV